MLSVAEARERILSTFQPLQTTAIPLQESAGRVLSQPIIADIDLPSFDNSSVDGFAVHSSDVIKGSNENPISLVVIGDIPAGKITSVETGQGECMRIMTGAPIPPGTDAVVMVEDTDFNNRDAGVPAPKRLTVMKSVKPGENIRRQGADIRSGQTILEKSHRLKAQDIGLLAMLGISKINVHRKPCIALISTGDELTSLDGPLLPGKIRDANSHSLSALAIESGAEVVNLGIADDDPASIKKLLDKAYAKKVDLIISSAGVSVGAFDYVKRVVESKGALDFWKVNMRPGKPFAFGNYCGIPFFGLPGNPVSAFISFMVFISPTIDKLSGQKPYQRPVSRVRLGEKIESDGRESYLRAVISKEENHQVARLTGHQVSSNLLSLVQANALLIIPSGVKSVPLGEEVDAWLL
jgi:molybdopterin molybdotransferase